MYTIRARAVPVDRDHGDLEYTAKTKGEAMAMAKELREKQKLQVFIFGPDGLAIDEEDDD